MDELVFVTRNLDLSFYWISWKRNYAIMKILNEIEV